MIAEKNHEADQAASSMWILTEDYRVREQIRRREDNEREYNSLVERANERDAAVQERNVAVQERDVAVQRADKMEKQLEELKAKLASFSADH